MDTIEDRSEIAFFDVETTVPSRPGQGHAILEFGAILVCPRKLVELGNYSSLVRPADLSLISSLSVRCNGITRDAVLDAPTFRDISDRVYELLQGRIWAGHNIVRFDCARIREAFAEIGKPAPEPKGTIDSLALLTQKFGRRAGDMKMATLATYFGLGKQTHRSLDDVRMNLEVVKYCATVLFLESSLPDIFTTNSWVSPNAITRSRSNGKSTPEGMNRNMNSSLPSLDFENNPTLSPTNHAITRSRSNGKSTPEGMNRNMNSSSPSLNFENNPTLSPTNHAITRSHSKGKSTPEWMNRNMNSSSPNLNFENSPTLSPTNQRGGENHSILSPITCGTGKEVLNQVESTIARRDPFNMEPLRNEMKTVSFQPDVTMEEQPVPESPEMSSTGAVSEGCSGYAGFLEPDEVSIPSISASLVPFYRGSQRIKILHNNVTLQLCCTHLKVRFGINSKFVDHAGRPRLSIVVDTSPSLCRVLDACDDLAKKLSVDSGSSSEWRPVVIRKNGFLNSSTVRLNISTVTNGNIAIYATEIYQTESSGNMQRLAFSRFDAAELAALFIPGTFVDACFSLDPYDYQQNAGIRLVAKKLTIHSM